MKAIGLKTNSMGVELKLGESQEQTAQLILEIFIKERNKGKDDLIGKMDLTILVTL